MWSTSPAVCIQYEDFWTNGIAGVISQHHYRWPFCQGVSTHNPDQRPTDPESLVAKVSVVTPVSSQTSAEKVQEEQGVCLHSIQPFYHIHHMFIHPVTHPRRENHQWKESGIISWLCRSRTIYVISLPRRFRSADLVANKSILLLSQNRYIIYQICFTLS